MSFFFDVWMSDCFILASDVRLIEEINGVPNQRYLHKLMVSPYCESSVRCAMAFCGDNLEVCKNYFSEACAHGNNLREISEHFGKKWTARFAGTAEYSAVHIVGYERSQINCKFIPQMWYWHNWDVNEGFIEKERLEKDFISFTDPSFPANYHFPQYIEDYFDHENEYEIVMDYLKRKQAIFTWNGDIKFWGSAMASVASALELLKRDKVTWTTDEVIKITTYCLEFITKVGNILPNSTVGFSPDGDFDLLVLSENKLDWIYLSKLPEL